MTDFRALENFFASAKAAGLSPVGVFQKDAQINGKGWQNGVASLRPGSDGVGIITDHTLVAIDFDDIKDNPNRAASDALLDRLLQLIPGAAVRRGDPTGSKWLVPVRTKAPCARARTLTDASGRKMQIIANRGQFVAFGNHDSKNPFGSLNEYSWSNWDALAALRGAPEVADVIALAAELGFTGAEPTDVANLSIIQDLKPTDVAVQAMVKSMANSALDGLRERGRDGTITGTAVMSTASRVAPAVHWGLLEEDAIIDAACAHGRDPDDNQGKAGRTYREEVERGLNNPLDSHEILELVRSAAPAPSTFDHIDPSQFTAAPPAQQQQVAGFRFISPFDTANDNTNPWVVRRLLRAGYTASIYAPPKAGKSTMTTDLAFHIATGKAWQGHEVKRAVPVLYITERPYQIKSSMRALASRHGVKPNNVMIIERACLISDPAFMGNMLATFESFKDAVGEYPGVLVFDTFAKAAAGMDENSASDIAIANMKLRDIQATHPQLLILTVGHTGKDSAKGERGSNATMGDRDLGLEVVQHDGGARSCRIAYANELEADKSIATFNITADKIGEDSDGEGIFGMVIEPAAEVVREREETMYGKYTESQLQNTWRLMNAYSEEGDFTFDDGGIATVAKRIIVPEQLDRAICEGLGTDSARGREAVVENIERMLGKAGKSLLGVTQSLSVKNTRYFKSEAAARIIPGSIDGGTDA